MFLISNRAAYSGLMVKATPERRSAIRSILGPSGWTNVVGTGEDKWSPEEGEIVVSRLRALSANGIVNPDIFIITPFRVVAQRLRERVATERDLRFDSFRADARRWVTDRIGTVHTFQGREADTVVLVLGAPLPGQAGARGWAGSSPNILNVAVTRAKENLYVIGALDRWRSAGHFKLLAELLPAAFLPRTE